jgi:thiamine pyrophosphate-dependent acetolactate synthase large subunit-like protein
MTDPPKPPADATAADQPQPAADLFVRCLESEGVEVVFGIRGEETLAVSEALERSERITFMSTTARGDGTTL